MTPSERAAWTRRLAVFCRVAAYTGTRRGELQFLRSKDMGLNAPEPRLRGPTGVVDGERVQGATKGGRERRVSLDAETPAMLAEQRRAM